MIWTAWKNSKHSNPNASYGFKVSIKDKYAYFNDSFKDSVENRNDAKAGRTF